MTTDRYNEIMSVLDDLHNVIVETAESLKEDAENTDSEDLKLAA